MVDYDWLQITICLYYYNHKADRSTEFERLIINEHAKMIRLHCQGSLNFVFTSISTTSLFHC